MPRQILVDDPLYKGHAPVPQVTRSQAMRRMHFNLGMSVGEVARHFGITYHLAYKQIQPPRLAAASPRSTAPKPLTTERLSTLSRSQLDTMAHAKGTNDPAIRKRVEAASDELDRRFPGWNDEVEPIDRTPRRSRTRV